MIKLGNLKDSIKLSATIIPLIIGMRQEGFYSGNETEKVLP